MMAFDLHAMSGMIGSTRRSAIEAAAVLAISGCFWFGGSNETSSPRLQSAEISSHTPLLTAFTLRVALADVPLDEKDTALATQLEHDCEPWMQKVDDARDVLIETLVRDVEQHRFSPEEAKAAGDRVVAATDEAAPHLAAALVQLHDALDPWQRRTLEQDVRARFVDWSTEWNAESATEHGWLATLSGPALADPATLERDTHATARHWVDTVVAEVGVRAPLASFSDADRSDLIARLRGP